MADIAMNFQTPMMRSTRDRLKKLQDENGHETLGETIGWLIDECEKLKAELELTGLDEAV